jgi:16S rRNA processing protein RimM
MGGDSSTLMHVGFVGAPFGVRGWVKLRSHTNPPERLLDHRCLQIGRDGAWVEYRVEERGRSGGVPTAKLSGVEDRDQAAALRGAQISIPRADLPPRSAKDFYRSDLIGCAVVNLNGVDLGVVQHFVETAAQALMVVRGEREYWVPAVPRHLRRVDLAARRIVVDWDTAAD